jgi:RNA-directed DNA polymerase
MLSRSDLVKALSGELGMLPIQLELIIRTAPLRYKVFTIPKRDGSPRTVAQPAREVKAIQRWLVNDLNTVLPVHQAATAYRKGTSIKINAAKHVQSNFILKMDFKNFFPSIEFKDLCAHLQKYASEKYDESAIHMIARL